MRNFNKEKIDIIVINMGELLKRTNSVAKKNEIINEFNLEIALICFESEFLERKL